MPFFYCVHGKGCPLVFGNPGGSMKPTERRPSGQPTPVSLHGLARCAPLAQSRNVWSVAWPPGLDTRGWDEPRTVAFPAHGEESTPPPASEST